MDSLDELPSAVRCSTLAVLDSIFPSVHSIMMSVVLIRFSVRAASLIPSYLDQLIACFKERNIEAWAVANC
jgi:hypothetical protein